jgi:hypothetical protein
LFGPVQKIKIILIQIIYYKIKFVFVYNNICKKTKYIYRTKYEKYKNKYLKSQAGCTKYNFVILHNPNPTVHFIIKFNLKYIANNCFSV